MKRVKGGWKFGAGQFQIPTVSEGLANLVEALMAGAKRGQMRADVLL